MFFAQPPVLALLVSMMGAAMAMVSHRSCTAQFVFTCCWCCWLVVSSYDHHTSSQKPGGQRQQEELSSSGSSRNHCNDHGYLIFLLLLCACPYSILQTTAPNGDDFVIVKELYGSPAAAAGSSIMLDDSSSSEFGATIDWRGTKFVVGAPLAGDNEQGEIIVYNENYEVFWSVAGSVHREKLGNRFALNNNEWLAIRRQTSVQVYNLATQALMGSPIPSAGLSVSLSNNNNLLAISEENHGGGVGRVRIMEFQEDSSSTWMEMKVFPALVPGGLFGWRTVFCDDGSRVAISAPNTGISGNDKQGMVVVYGKDSDSSSSGHDQWSLLGQILYGDEAGEQFGFSLAFSGDGSTLVVGSPRGFGLKGKVKVFTLDNTNSALPRWTPAGEAIPGQEGDRFGRSLDVNHDGSLFVASSFAHAGHRGQTRIFNVVVSEEEYSNAEQPTKKIEEVGAVQGRESLDRMGFGVQGVCLSPDGLLLAAGSVLADNLDGFSVGKVEIFDLEGSASNSETHGVPSAAATYIPSTSPTAPVVVKSASSPSPAPTSTSYPSDGPSVSSLPPTSGPSWAPSTNPPTISTKSAQPSSATPITEQPSSKNVPSSSWSGTSLSPSADPTRSTTQSDHPSAFYYPATEQPSASNISSGPSVAPSSNPSTSSGTTPPSGVQPLAYVSVKPSSVPSTTSAPVSPLTPAVFPTSTHDGDDQDLLSLTAVPSGSPVPVFGEVVFVSAGVSTAGTMMLVSTLATMACLLVAILCL